ncbi:hypothetical protein SY212_03550 [Ligilactobacillus agilis]|uniref:Uncharacterized protein n=1 Tax=Ligilactobacillus agilis TaxID=1601 RepID=A0A6F9XJE6_9LACO|nr:hypothetical protein [Ligilactobacillus agilis]GET05325.1 hypothetical protein SY212_03550 [Ligilactobacillus agilis]
MEQKYWIHVLPVESGYLFKQWERFGLGKKEYREGVYDVQKEWTLDEIKELQKLPTFKNIKLRECLEPYEPTPKEIPDFCTVVFQGAEGDSWEVDYEARNIYIYENGDIRYQGRDERTDTFGLYRIVKIWDDEKDFDEKIVEKIIKQNRRRFAPDDKPIHVAF